MKFFNFFKKETKNTEVQENQLEGKINYEKLNNLLDIAIEKYHVKYCQCAYPRFIQISSIDCFNYHKSFHSVETELLIEKSKKYFDVEKFDKFGECSAEKWKCKKCKSEFEFYWSDMSIYLNRATLKPININTVTIGKQTETPIPLFIGLIGYSYPSDNKIKKVNFENFEKYILET